MFELSTPVTVLLDDVGDHVPLAPVVGGRVEEEAEQPPVRPLLGLALGHLHNSVKEEVGALDLW